MNTKILQKCLEELKKDTPDLSYLRGTLETLIEMAGGIVFDNTLPNAGLPRVHTTTGKDLVGKVDEITDVDKEFERKMANGPIANLKG